MSPRILLIGLRSASYDVVGIQIAYRQRIAALTILEQEPSLEIHGLDFVGVAVKYIHIDW